MAHTTTPDWEKEAASRLAYLLHRAGIATEIHDDPLVVLVLGMPFVNVRIEWVPRFDGYGFYWRPADRDPADDDWQWDVCPLNEPGRAVQMIAPHHPIAQQPPPAPLPTVFPSAPAVASPPRRAARPAAPSRAARPAHTSRGRFNRARLAR